MRLRPLLVAVATLAVYIAFAAPAGAFRAPDHDVDYEIVPAIESTVYFHRAAEIASDQAASAYGEVLTREFGSGWRVTHWNQFSEAPVTAEGPGILVAPGGVASATELEMEALGRSIIAAHPAVFGTDGSNLEVLRITHGAERWGVIFQQVEGGIPVMHAAVVLAIHDNGKLFGFEASLYRDLQVSLVPRVERAVAQALARSSVPFDPQSTLEQGDDTMVIVPVHQAPGEVEYHLTHRTDVATSDPIGMWRTYVDAHSGEIVLRTNEVHFAYEGSVHGDVEYYTYCNGETPDVPTKDMYVLITGVGMAITDANGDFSMAGSSGSHPFTVTLDGPDFNVICSGCTDAQQTGTIYPDTPLDLYWDDTEARDDERDTFWHANRTKDYIQEIDPSWSWPKYNAYVNINDYCNAYHQGTTINFFRAGGGCANTGTIGTVISHEYGHGIQYSLLGGQGQQGLGEGNSDITANFISDDSRMGVGFYSCPNPMPGRDCDNELHYPEDLTGQIHDDGRLICGFNWDVWHNLVAYMGVEDGKAHAAYLWHFSRKLWGYSGWTQPVQAERYRWADDDDSNMANGTPNWDAICEAAIDRGYGCPDNPNRIEITHTPLVDMTNPAGPYTVTAEVATYVAGSATSPEDLDIYYSINGGPFSVLPMTNTGGNNYEADIPTQTAGTAVAYYIRAQHSGGNLDVYHPDTADQGAHHLFGLGTFAEIADHEMEADLGYTVGAPGDNATAGLWERGDPVGVSLGIILQPEDDHTPSPGTDCWVTGNSASPAPLGDELDGRTSLNTGIIDMAGANLVSGSFWAFTYFSTSDPDIYLDFNMSTDGGATWTTVQRINESVSPDWTEFNFRLSPVDFNFTSQMQFRFVASDNDGFAIAEALVDDLYIEGLFGGATAIAEPAASAPLTLRLGHATPNPFNPSTSIHYSLATTSDVKLSIFDVQGRMVRTLVENSLDAGEYATEWDGRDASGVASASGVYYYKLEVGDWSDTKAMVLLK
jgi:hypothetical protein